MHPRLVLMALGLFTLQACGGSSGRAPDAAIDAATADGNAADHGNTADAGNTADVGGADSAAAGCGGVCWRPLPRLAAAEAGETVTFVSAECRCPGGFACTGAKTTQSGAVTSTYPVCEPVAPPPHPLAMTFDFRDDLPTFPVTLRFRLNGGAWPESPVAGSAGQITITPEPPQEPLVLPMPTAADGALTVQLPRGRHGFRLELGRGPTFDPFKYPITNLAGELTVEAAGETTVDLQAPAFSYQVRVNGQPLPPPKDGEVIALRIEGRYGHRFQLKRGPGQRLEDATIWLEPGRYTATLTTEGAFDGTPSLPNGFVILTHALEIAAVPVSRRFDVGLFKVTGALTIDGKDLPADSTVDVELTGLEAAAHARVGAARPARYEVLAFGGEYDVLLETAGPTAAGVPDGSVRAFSKQLVDRDVAADIAAATARWSGEVTLNGAPLPSSPFDRGTLQLSEGVNHTFSLGQQGSATVTALVYRGRAVPTIFGTATSGLPNLGVLAPVIDTSVTPARLEVQAAPVNVSLRIDGLDPPSAQIPRGFFRFSRPDGTGETGLIGAGSTGPLTASFALSPGVWKALFRTNTGADGLPLGDVELPDLVVPPEGLTHTYEVSSVALTIDVRRNGAALADAATGSDRGTLQVGSTRVRLPRTGPAQTTLKVFPGVTSVSLVCDDSCSAGLPAFLILVPYVRL